MAIPVASGTTVTRAAGASIQLSSLFTYSDLDNDIVSFAVRDRELGGGYLTRNGVRQTENVLIDPIPIGEIGLWAFVAGPAGSTSTIGFNANDSLGGFNPSAVSTVIAAAAVNNVPTASGTTLNTSAGVSTPLSALFSFSDLDNDIVSFAVRDRELGGGYLTRNSVRQAENTLFDPIPIGEIGLWAFVAGPAGSTSTIGFNANDSHGAFSPSVLTTVSVAGATVGVFSITPATASVAENSPGFIDFVVTRTASTSTESVYFSTILNGGVNTADYTSIGDRQLTFGPSATATSQTVRVQITPDTQVEANQTFGVIIQRTPNPDPNVFLDKSLFTILNDDVATGTAGVFSITPATASVAENSPGFIDFVVTRTASTSTESVYFSTILNGGVNTADYTSIVDRQLTFAPSSTATSQTVRVQITPDTQVEANQTFGVIIQRTPNPDPNVFLDKSLFTIVNDDVAQPTLLGSDALFSKNGGQYVTLAEFSNAAYAENSLTRTALGFDGWKPLASADLGGLPGLSNGMYVNGTATAFLARSQDALVVSFRGTDSIWDFAQGSVSIIHYAQYQALLSAIEAAAGLYSKIYVTGHSLGAAVAQMFMEDHPDLKYSAVTFASPGSPLLFDLADSRTINFRNEDDPIRAARLTGVYHWVGDDKNIMFNEGVDNISLTLTSQHEMSLYFSVLRYLSTEKVSESWYGLGGIDTIVVPSTSTVSLYQIGLNDYFDGGAQNDRLIGSNARDLLVSGAGADVINGLAGADVMYGGDGNDTYYADHRTDVVTETNTVAATGGFDRIITTDSRTLGANIEYLFLSGAAPINGTGNTLSNLIVGNVAANAINGGLGTDFIYGDGGNDALTGGLGTDYFVFRTTPNATTNRDIITDFDAALDTIRLENTGVGLFNLLALGTLNAAFFKANAAGVATDSNDRIIYDIDSGALFYDTNGNAVGGAVQFAMLTSAVKPVLSSADFFVI